jgi:His-Xaa-Ser system protein HxsD
MKELSFENFEYDILIYAISEFETKKNVKINYKIDGNKVYFLSVNEDEFNMIVEFYNDFLLRKRIANETKKIREMIVHKALFELINEL